MSEAVPAGLSAGGAHLWASLLAQDKTLEAESNPARALALEACRAKDRLDQLDELLRGEVRTWAYLTETKSGGSWRCGCRMRRRGGVRSGRWGHRRRGACRRCGAGSPPDAVAAVGR
jgi:hypothetical protein